MKRLANRLQADWPFQASRQPYFYGWMIAVISTLGLNRAWLSPWARLQSPPDLVQRVMATLVRACDDPDGPRVVWMSAGGVGPSAHCVTLPIRLLIRSGTVALAELLAGRDVDRGGRP